MAKFLDDGDDEFVDFINTADNESFVKAFTAHKDDVLLTIDDITYNVEKLEELPEGTLKNKVQHYLKRSQQAERFKEITNLGKDFENLVSSKIKSIPPFSTLFKDYTHLKQVYLKGQKETIIADDLFVKQVFDEVEEVDYFRAVISDSKLNTNSPWTKNQKSELIDVFKNNPNKKYIEFEVRTNNKFLKEANAPKDFMQDIKVRIYREDVYKIISEGENIKIPPTNMNNVNFKN